MNFYVGFNFERDWDARLLFIHQCSHLEKILWDYGFDHSMEVATPVDSNSTLRQANTTNTKFMGDSLFTNVVGSLQWIGLVTRPNISFSVSNVACFKVKPTKMHYSRVKWIFCYIKGILDFKLVNGITQFKNLLIAFTDADCGRNLKDHNLQSSYILYFNGGPISWDPRNRMQLWTSLLT